ncbi:MAG TPA: hypothetical protein VFL85_04715 [Candidatus Saccharimonadales bacterium]|nr:hypothetical protein [Candidatus Saccharimonadales bacterium]
MDDKFEPTARKVQRAEERHTGAVPLDQPFPEELTTGRNDQLQPSETQNNQPPESQQDEQNQTAVSDTRRENMPAHEAAASKHAHAEAHNATPKSIAFIGVTGGFLLIIGGLFLLVLKLYVAAIIIIIIGIAMATVSFAVGAKR